jgi:hypothetical protein
MVNFESIQTSSCLSTVGSMEFLDGPSLVALTALWNSPSTTQQNSAAED